MHNKLLRHLLGVAKKGGNYENKCSSGFGKETKLKAERDAQCHPVRHTALAAVCHLSASGTGADAGV